MRGHIIMRTNSPCIEHVEGNHYRCKNLGFDVYTDELPISCGPCDGDRRSGVDKPVPQGIAGRIINLEAEARAAYAKMLYAREPAELTRVITTCLACQKYDNRCNDTRPKNGTPLFPSGCTGRRQWLKSLSSVGFRECPKWGLPQQ